MHVGRYVDAHMHRKLFIAFAIAITVACAAVVGVFSAFGGGFEHAKRELRRVEKFASHLFAGVWDDPVERERLARDIAEDLDANVALRDVNGRIIVNARSGEGIGQTVHLNVMRAHQRIGTLEVQLVRTPHRHELRTLALALLVAMFVLWMLAGMAARRAVRPLRELTRVAGELGDGRLESRARIRFGMRGELGTLANAINDMATRIERQVRSQKELLAAVSHELRTPLSRIRLLVDIGRDNPDRTDIAEQIEAEVMEMDSLVGELLAGARVDFDALTLRPIDGADAARRAWERAAIPNGELQVVGEVGQLTADATLLARALGSLLDNAKKHGGDRVLLRVSGDERYVRFDVEDNGAGFADGEQERVFMPFYQSRSRAEGESRGIGLGLALVRRIAEAHRGRASAKNCESGGACVSIELPRAPAGTRA